ncbi:HAD family hydrolase [Singulisphaera acidiphila]|uniref:Haloacid dehalogenase superfamily enzyme, subfamily IA n=1 Tax=Singulisphaera acidiphila (strain ATCC BAA-1392 / DSM 18658 / VKM B-2454 / MOB10) TaxID=886293 RepID=L0DKG1_SINAD|nr:HAD family hydrolase [Singulisphaera acidiphila]AGA29747.1 haloacid dehalogenase superfamily enzyme, subfamily IA [Singulisphaera acidiphila DSM 18658]
MIRWAFLDVGNILLDEDPIAYRCTRLHWEAVQRVQPDLTFLEFMAAREERSIEGLRWPLYEVVSALMDEAACAEAWNVAEREIRGRYHELSPVITGARELVDRLASRFQLGLIANQGPECRTLLDDLHLLGRFKVVTLSEEVGLFKPNPALYLRALGDAGIDPSEGVMIGDRLDNDIEPAATLGMATVWARWAERKNKAWRPNDPDALAFRDSLERSTAQSAGRYRGPRPSLVVDHLGEIDSETVANLRS